jgi:hypothetical protein
MKCCQKKIGKDGSGIINFQPSNCYGSHRVLHNSILKNKFHKTSLEARNQV